MTARAAPNDEQLLVFATPCDGQGFLARSRRWDGKSIYTNPVDPTERQDQMRTACRCCSVSSGRKGLGMDDVDDGAGATVAR